MYSGLLEQHICKLEWLGKCFPKKCSADAEQLCPSGSDQTRSLIINQNIGSCQAKPKTASQVAVGWKRGSVPSSGPSAMRIMHSLRRSKNHAYTALPYKFSILEGKMLKDAHCLSAFPDLSVKLWETMALN